jgi:hypothetical protein
VSGFAALLAEAVRDAARRRIVAVIAVVSLLSLLMVDSCTSCSTGEIVVNGQVQRLVDLAGYTGTLTVVLLGLWCVVLAGILAAEHLAETISDGSAALCLARPVSRGAFAAARLGGALAIAWATGAVLVGATAFFLSQRGGLPLLPALWAGLVVAVAGLAVGALSMTASLYLPRIATVLLVFAVTGLVTLANGVGLARTEPSGWLAQVDRLGPPLASALAVALAPWTPGLVLDADPLLIGGRLALWAAGSVGLLWLAVSRIELGR